MYTLKHEEIIPLRADGNKLKFWRMMATRDQKIAGSRTIQCGAMKEPMLVYQSKIQRREVSWWRKDSGWDEFGVDPRSLNRGQTEREVK